MESIETAKRGDVQIKKSKPRSMNKFIMFSVIFFLIILIAGSTAFIFSMQQIIGSNKVNELSRVLEVERIKLETSLNAEIAIVLKLADSPLIKRYFLNPYDAELEKVAFEEIASYRRAFTGYSIFWINDIDRIFYSDDNNSYWVEAEEPENYWYPLTLHETEVYNFNINFNPDIEEIKLWINAPVFDDEHKPIGMVGTGIELSSFIDMIYQDDLGGAELYLFNAKGEITGARDIEPVVEKRKIKEELGDASADIFAEAINLESDEIRTIDIPAGKAAVGMIPVLEWYAVAVIPNSLSDYMTPMTVLFLAVLVLILMIFIIFNVFISKFLKSLHKTMESLENASKAKSQFLAKVSHEIRTPMNAIMGMSELMLRENLPQSVCESTLLIKNASTNLLSIINDILDFSKIESGMMEIIETNYSFPSLINDVAGIIRIRVHDKPIQFMVNIDPDIPASLIGDEIRIREILINLLGNAVKYTNEGFISLTVEGKINENVVILSMDITDSGIGVKAEDIEKLFGDFVQINSAANRGIEGTGLGLAISRNLCRMMNGDITAHSVYGKGSTFTVTLPQRFDSYKPFASADIPDETPATSISFTAPDARILIVDDITANLKVAKGLMAPYEMQIDLSANGKDAIQRIQENSYDLVFMDHMMPEMDGLEATARIRVLDGERYQALTIIALTANAVSGVREMFLQNGMNDFLSKPIEMAKLNAILEKWIPKEKQQIVKRSELDIIYNSPETENFINEARKLKWLSADKASAALSGFATYERTFRISVRLLPENVEKLEACIDTDLSLYAVEVHGIKGVLNGIGAYSLGKEALELENLSKANDAKGCINKHPSFIAEVKAFLEAATPLLGEDEKQRGELTELANAIPKIEQAIEAYDGLLALEILSSLAKYTYDQPADALLGELVGAFEHFDFDKASNDLQDLKTCVGDVTNGTR